MRDGLSHFGQTTITLLTWIGASWVTMPPDWAPRCVVGDLGVLLDPVDALDEDAFSVRGRVG